jgi:hypothetical protein
VLFPKRFWDGLRDGSVTVAFRYWRRPTVRAGGTLQAPVGVLAIESVERVGLRDVTVRDALAAGYPSRSALTRDLERFRKPEAALYRIAFHYQGEDPRRALREDIADLDAVRDRLARIDRASARGPWTRSMLELIRDNEAVLAADLAASVGREKLPFKADVRKLKALGLTISLERGYRLSPRGVAYLRSRG